MTPSFSHFASSVRTEGAFQVLAVAKRLVAAGKDVIELEIGDSPFPSASSAVAAGLAAIQDDQCHYGPAIGLPAFREAAAEYVNRHYGLSVGAENIVAGPGAKPFEQFFCEAFLNPGDGVIVFSPHFPTYEPNIRRRGARLVLSPLRQDNDFRPNLDDVAQFLDADPAPKAVFLNSPHNPTGGVATRQDIAGLANLVRGRDVAIFSDEPYDRMVWRGDHHTPLAQPGMIDQCVAAYTFSKSYSMSGWRLGFAVCSESVAALIGTLTNTALSCVPPFTQLAGIAALREDGDESDDRMQQFHRKVQMLVDGLSQIDGVHCLMPGGTFYVFPSVAVICNRLRITSHGLAMFLLEGADDNIGVACLGGECFGRAGQGFIRFSCAESDERLQQAVRFIAPAVGDVDRVATYLAANPQWRLSQPYGEPA